MKRVEGMPRLVYFGLLGVNSKQAAYFYALLCVLIGVVVFAFAKKGIIYFAAVVMFVAALWYLHCIRWVDKHAAWE